jgi:hypothetical protein
MCVSCAGAWFRSPMCRYLQDRHQLVSRAARTALLKGLIGQSSIEGKDLRACLGERSRQRLLGRALLRETQLFLRRGLGLDLVPFVKAVDESKAGPDSYLLKNRRDESQFCLLPLPELDRLARDPRADMSDVDKTVAREAPSSALRRNAIVLAATAFVFRAGGRPLRDEDLFLYMQSLDPQIESVVGGTNWKHTLKQWLSRAGFVTFANDSEVGLDGETTRSIRISLGGGARAAIGAPALTQFTLMTLGKQNLAAQAGDWFHSELIEFPDDPPAHEEAPHPPSPSQVFEAEEPEQAASPARREAGGVRHEAAAPSAAAAPRSARASKRQPQSDVKPQVKRVKRS